MPRYAEGGATGGGGSDKSFCSKPSRGWLHTDHTILNEGVTFNVRYIGCLEIRTSMKALDFALRSRVAKECISRVCEAASLKTSKKRRVDKQVIQCICDKPEMYNAGQNATLTVSSKFLSLVTLETNEEIAKHDMPKISFASGGDSDTLDFVAYVAKNEKEWRACYVLECGGGQAQDLIATIGQAFELRFNEYFNKTQVVKNGTITYDGVAFQILHFLADKFNFTYSVITPPANKMGSTDDMTGSLIETVTKTNADMVAAFLPIISDARLYIDYSTTTLDEGEWMMIMKRPAESATGSGLLAPFNRSVWTLIFVSLFAVGPIIYGLIIVRNKLTKDNSQKFYSLPNCVWFVYGALMKQGSTLSPSSDSTRLLFATWWIFITILTSFYTANLTAFLTLSKFTLPINEVDDILSNNKPFVAPSGDGVEYAIKNPNEALTKLMKMVEKKKGIFTETNDDEAALIRDKPAMQHLMYKDYNYRKTITVEVKAQCPFAVATKPFMRRKRAFAYPRNSTWSNLFDPELLHLVESGIVKYMLMEKLPRAEICPQNLGGTERQLRNGDLIMTYQVMAAGFGTGVAVFFTEILFRCLLNRQKDLSVSKDKDLHNKKIDKLIVPTITPPPSYATLYNRSRNNNIWTLSETEKKNTEGVTQYINGRQYVVVKGCII